MKIFGGPKKPRRFLKLNKFGADRHHREYDERKRNGLTRGSVLRYTHMPEILPRIRALGQKFGHFAFMLALIFRSARLLPAAHPMLNPVNIGRFGVRDVIATAANNLVLKRENLDQIVVFGAVITSILMIFIQAILIGFYAFFSSAQASTGMFITPNPNGPNGDVVFQFLRQVFGVDGIFGPLTGQDGPQPGFHAILGFYSTAMMIIAVLIVIYHVIVVVGEAAQSGKPFGGRFNSLWAPVRLVLALGLLVPLGGGLNAAQYGVLYIAKMGSGFATQGWIEYTSSLAKLGNFAGSSTDNSANLATSPNVEMLVQRIFQYEACRDIYLKVHGPTNPIRVLAAIYPRAGVVKNVGRISIQPKGATSFVPAFSAADVLKAASENAATLKYVWTRDPVGTVNPTPLCGAITFNLTMSPNKDSSDVLTKQSDDIAASVVGKFAEIIKSSITNFSGDPATKDARGTWALLGNNDLTGQFAQTHTSTNTPSPAPDTTAFDRLYFSGKISAAIDTYQTQMNGFIHSLSVGVIEDKLLTQTQKDANDRGWGTAGIYYMEMAKVHQAVLNAIYNSSPVVIADRWTAWDERSGTQINWFDMGKPVESVKTSAEIEVSEALTMATVVVMGSHGSVPAANFKGYPTAASAAGSGLESSMQSDNFKKALLFLFGDAFVRMIDEPSLVPMANLVQGGSDILTRSYEMLTVWAAASGLNALIGWTPGVGGIADIAVKVSGFLLTIGLAVGIVMFYVLPLMPFMYFFFSVVNWIIEVVEAFVEMPLFALAHLRIDGEGLPGQTAYNGYLTLFGIFLRPLLIVIGLIVSSLIFGAASFYLASTYKYAIFSYKYDATGAIEYGRLNGFDILMYLILFVYMTYILANSCFKLIDKLPDEMMRWIGGQRGFTGDRPVDIGNMQGMALAGYGALRQAQGAAESGVNSFSKNVSQPVIQGGAARTSAAANPRGTLDET